MADRGWLTKLTSPAPICSLLFIAADILGNKWVKLLVMALSLFILSRLLIFSIVIYYLVKYGKGYFQSAVETKRHNYNLGVFCLYFPVFALVHPMFIPVFTMKLDLTGSSG